jgi:hypothetical protein
MEDNKIDFGFIAVSGICALGLAGLFFYLNKKNSVANVIDSKINTGTKPVATVINSKVNTDTKSVSNTGFSGSSTKINETIKQITPEMIQSYTAEGIVSNINRLNTVKLNYAIGSNPRKSAESTITSLKKTLTDLGYKFDDLLKKAVSIDTNKVLNVSENQSNQALLNNTAVSDEDKANSIAKKIQLIFDTQSATESNAMEYLRDILDLGYVFERNDKGEGVARKVYDINRVGTNIISKGFIGKSKNFPLAKEYPIKLYKKSPTGVLTEIGQSAVFSADELTKIGDALEDKFKQINEQTKSIVKENKEQFKNTKLADKLNDVTKRVQYNTLVDLLSGIAGAQTEHTKATVENKNGFFAKLNFSYNNSNWGQIKRGSRIILDFPNTTFFN